MQTNHITTRYPEPLRPLRLLLAVIVSVCAAAGCRVAPKPVPEPSEAEAPAAPTVPESPSAFAPEPVEDAPPPEAHDAEALEEEAAEAHARGRLAEAFELYERALMANPERPDLYHRLAVVAEALENLPRAISAYEGLLEVDADSPWAVLAVTRLDVLRRRAAVERLRAAQRAAAAEEYQAALRMLGEAAAFKPGPGTLRRIRRLYYPYCCRAVAESLRDNVADGIELIGVTSGDVPAYQRAAFLAELRRALNRLAPAGLRYTPLPGRVLLRLMQSETGDAVPEAGLMGARARWLLAASLGGELRFVTVDAQEKRVQAVETFQPPGPIPPRHRSAVWARLPSGQVGERGINLRLWAGGQEARAGEAVAVHLWLNRAGYVALFHIGSQGAVALVPVQDGEPGDLLRPNREYTAWVPAGEGGTVEGVVALASRTALFDPLARMAPVGGEALDRALREIAEGPENAWTAARWTWYIREAPAEDAEPVDRDVHILPLPAEEVELP